MDHDRMMGRQLLATLAILACGLVPDRLAGRGPARLREPHQRPVQPDRRLADRARLLRAAARRRPPARRPGRSARPCGAAAARAVPSRPRSTRRRWSCGSTTCARSSCRPSDRSRSGASRWRTNAQGMRDREYSDRQAAGHVPDRAGGRLDRRGLGRQRRASGSSRSWSGAGTRGRGARADPRSRSSTAPCRAMRPASAGIISSEVGWPMRPDLVICESTEADVGWDERRLRYVLARGPGLRLAALPRGAGRRRGPAGLEPRRVQARAAAAPPGDPGRGLPGHGGRRAGRTACRSSGC